MLFKILKRKEVDKLHQEIHHLKIEFQTATGLIEDIKNGRLDTIHNEQQQGQLTTSLIAMQRQLQAFRKKEQERNWVAEGLAQFSQIVRNHHDSVHSYGEQAISALVKYLSANQGAFFLLEHQNEENEALAYLDMVACYAYNRKKHFKKRIHIGEGLAGQCIIEKDTLFLTDVPSDYLSITSGLGEATPNALLIVPLKLGDEVFGCIELASFTVFQPYQIEFVEKVSENIAGTIRELNNSEKNQKLLHEARELGALLQTQEEEMRQNMEELQAAQEELVHKSHENIKTIEELRQKHDRKIDELKAKEEYLQSCKTQLIEKLTNNNALIDIAGRQRMLSQKIGFYVEMIARGRFEKYMVLEKAIHLHDTTLYIIKNGGIAPGIEHIEALPPADLRLVPAIKRVQVLWEKYKSSADCLVEVAKTDNHLLLESREVIENILFIEENGETLLQLNNQLLVECSKYQKELILEMYAGDTLPTTVQENRYAEAVN